MWASKQFSWAFRQQNQGAGHEVKSQSSVSKRPWFFKSSSFWKRKTETKLEFCFLLRPTSSSSQPVGSLDLFSQHVRKIHHRLTCASVIMLEITTNSYRGKLARSFFLLVCLFQHYFGFVHSTKNYLFGIHNVIRPRDPKWHGPS